MLSMQYGLPIVLTLDVAQRLQEETRVGLLWQSIGRRKLNCLSVRQH